MIALEIFAEDKSSYRTVSCVLNRIKKNKEKTEPWPNRFEVQRRRNVQWIQLLQIQTVILILCATVKIPHDYLISEYPYSIAQLRQFAEYIYGGECVPVREANSVHSRWYHRKPAWRSTSIGHASFPRLRSDTRSRILARQETSRHRARARVVNCVTQVDLFNLLIIGGDGVHARQTLGVNELQINSNHVSLLSRSGRDLILPCVSEKCSVVKDSALSANTMLHCK